jgi:NAD(P)-dependent dehydrogenase (short-subunit alcohol dehydrogenase family)
MDDEAVREMAAPRNKTALVTGASRGIGRATASALAAAGAHVLAHYGRSVQDVESLVADIRSKGGRADAIPGDLSQRTERHRCQGEDAPAGVRCQPDAG